MYYLVNGIYEYVVIVKTLILQGEPKCIKYKTTQEIVRKEIKRSFEALKCVEKK